MEESRNEKHDASAIACGIIVPCARFWGALFKHAPPCDLLRGDQHTRLS